MIEDVRRLGQVNQLISGAGRAVAAHREAQHKKPYRQVPYMYIAPTTRAAMGDIASDVFRRRYRGYRAHLIPTGRLTRRPTIDSIMTGPPLKPS